MNKHFEDTKYYVKRAGETAKKGLAEELEPLQERIQDLRDEEEDPELGRVKKLREDLKELQGRAEGEAKEALGEARERLDKVRQKPAE
ncbi:MAG: chaperonin cofactor prefoldin [Natronomonas sp.]|jgi:chaperonin cofactor prefoldin